MLRFYILLALLASLFLGCDSYFLVKKCGDDYYDPEMQFCQDALIYDKCGGRGYDPLNQKCENNILSSKCENDYYPEVQFCQDTSIYDKCGDQSYNPLNQKCEDNTLFSKCGDEWYNPFSEYCTSNVVENKEEFIDSRDGKAYKYVTIGTQIWMAENLRYETSNTRCYNDNSDNCETYGILYDWNTAKEVCPADWHLPSDTEWFTLRSSVGSNAGAKSDIKLMANSVLWVSGKGTDEFGFTALPGGYYRDEGYFLNIGVGAVFWSATEGYMAGSAHVHHISPLSWVREIDGHYTNNSWVYVRCVKDSQ